MSLGRAVRLGSGYALALVLPPLGACVKPASPPAPPDPQKTAVPAEPAAPPREALGEQASVAAADRAIGAEQVVGDYRIGLGFGAPRALYLPGAGARIQDKPGRGADAYMFVTVREARTKRHLPRVAVTASVPRGEFEVPALPLLEVWGEFAHYGANVPVVKVGHEFQVTLNISPPSYGRRQDCVGLWDQAVSAKFIVRRGDALEVVGEPARPADADWMVGGDVVQAVQQTRQRVDAGEYTVGFIVAGPAPLWRWGDGKAIPEPMPDDATHDLQIVLLETATGRLVTGAGVTLRLTPAGTGPQPIALPLLPLMGGFHHYGRSVAMPPGAYGVGVRVVRPTFTTLRADELARTLSFTLPEPWIVSP